MLKKLVAAAVLVGLGSPAPLTAATRGTAFGIATTTGGGVRYPDVAYDASNNVYLAVTGKGHVQAAWVSASRTILKAAVNVTSSSAYQQAPRAMCGESGNCLIVWHEGDNGTMPMARLASYDGGFLTAPFALGPLGSNWEMGAGIAYAPDRNEFLVVWMSEFNKGNNISFARVSLAGQKLATVQLTTGGGYEREPSVAYNPTSGEFVVSYAGTFFENGVEVAYTAAQRVRDGAAVGSRLQLDKAKTEYISNAAFNPATGTVLVTWCRGGPVVYGRNVFADGTMGSLLTMSSSAGAYDALDVAYNPISESFLLVTHASSGVEDAAVEISSGSKPSAPFTLTANGGTGNFNPRVVASSASPLWLAVTSSSFKTLVGQPATSTAGAGHCETNCTGGSVGGGGGGGTSTTTVSSLTASPSLPKPAGTQITWTAAASGGTSLQYQFWLYNGTTKAWSIGRAYSSTASWAWTPSAAGTYVVQVWVRSSTSTADYDAWRGTGSFTISASTTSTKATSVTLSKDKALPTAAGTTITWTGHATGTSTPEYQFWVYNSNTGAWTIARSYNTTPTFAWIPAQAGTYAVQVWARASGSSASYDSWATSGTFTITSSGSADMTSVTLGASRSFPMPVYTSVTFTGTANGSSPQYQYWLYNGKTGVWKMMQDYSADPTWLWIPLAKGTYVVQVWARPAGSTASYKAWASSGSFTVK